MHVSFPVLLLRLHFLSTSCPLLDRSSRNVLLRQGSHQPHTSTPSQWARSHTISGSRPSQSRGQSSALPLSVVATASSASPTGAQNQPVLETVKDSQEIEMSQKDVEIQPATENDIEAASELQQSAEEAVRSKVTSDVATDTEVRSKVTSDVATDTEVRRLLRQESVNMEVRQSPGFKFVTRPDLFKFAKVCT